MRDPQTTREQAEAVIALATEQGFPHYRAVGTIFRGWSIADADDGRVAEGIGEIRKGLNDYWTTGAAMQSPYFLYLLADAERRAGNRAAGLGFLDDAASRAERTGGRWIEAELHRLSGELLQSDWASSQQQQHAEERFRLALGVAHKQGAKLWELRAATSLARLLQDRDRQEARDLLTRTCDWFNEEFEMPDLQDARGLLRALV